MMEKRVQLIPLFAMIFCAGISLSSGLYYYDAKEYMYLLPMIFLSVVYYVARNLLAEEERREEIAFGIAGVLVVLVRMIFSFAVTPGLCELMQTISLRVEREFGVSLGTWEGGEINNVGLAVCYLVSIVTVLSLYLFEKGKHIVAVAMPSFLLFFASIAADGVPYEKCMVAYAMALLTFLGLGNRKGNVKKLALLLGIAFLTVVLSFQFISWSDMNPVLNRYRHYLVFGEGDQRTAPRRENLKFREDQTINFGQFNEEGDIYYSGTVQMELESEIEFTDKELYLRGFIGQIYNDSKWYGEEKGGYYVWEAGNVFKRNRYILLTPKYDVGNYFPYSANSEKYNRLLKRSLSLTRDEKTSFSDELYVEPDLKEQIQIQLLKKKRFETYGDVVDYVNRYLAANYEYTLHPGKKTEDELERFLFDSKKGYCTHFATAAVMMFRSEGIPARLAQGYMIDGVKIKAGETLNVQDSDAHAWVEIYVSKKGWIPVDATPYTNGISGEEGEGQVGDSEDFSEEEFEEEVPGEEPTQKETPEDDDQEADVVEDEDEEQDEEQDDVQKDDRKSNVAEVESEPFESTVFAKLWGHVGVRIVVHLLLGMICFVLVYRWYDKRQYRKMRREMKARNRSKRLLYINEELQPYWEALHVSWSYLDSEKMIQDIFQNLVAYYNIRNSEDAVNVQEMIQTYVLCVYMSRFGAEEISKDAYQESLYSIRDMLKKTKVNGNKKQWKKLSKCNMIKYILSRKNGG